MNILESKIKMIEKGNIQNRWNSSENDKELTQ